MKQRKQDYRVLDSPQDRKDHGHFMGKLVCPGSEGGIGAKAEDPWEKKGVLNISRTFCGCQLGDETKGSWDSGKDLVHFIPMISSLNRKTCWCFRVLKHYC